MQIRAVTVFSHPHALPRAAKIAATVRLVLEAADYDVQTTRWALPPFPLLVANRADAVALARQTDEQAAAHGLDYVALGPALPAFPETYTWLPDILAEAGRVFVSGVMADDDGLRPHAIQACADVMAALAPLEPNGFANLRFAALASVPPGAPFFPAAYAPPQLKEGDVLVALALEAADVAVTAFENAETAADARAALVQALESHGTRLADLVSRAAGQHGGYFLGLDFSLAPYPDEATSLGAALERLGVAALGAHGSLAAAAFLADALDRAAFPRTGFNGLMLPVLEDAVLAARAAEGVLSVKDLLLYSAVCGTGLDTVPLPGDTTADQMAAVLTDVAALARRLRKPLTARLMPMPGKRAGDVVTFDFPYFANSRVMPLQAAPLSGAVSTGDYDLRARCSDV